MPEVSNFAPTNRSLWYVGNIDLQAAFSNSLAGKMRAVQGAVEDGTLNAGDLDAANLADRAMLQTRSNLNAIGSELDRLTDDEVLPKHIWQVAAVDSDKPQVVSAARDLTEALAGVELAEGLGEAGKKLITSLRTSAYILGNYSR